MNKKHKAIFIWITFLIGLNGNALLCQKYRKSNEPEKKDSGMFSRPIAYIKSKLGIEKTEDHGTTTADKDYENIEPKDIPDVKKKDGSETSQNTFTKTPEDPKNSIESFQAYSDKTDLEAEAKATKLEQDQQNTTQQTIQQNKPLNKLEKALNSVENNMANIKLKISQIKKEFKSGKKLSAIDAEKKRLSRESKRQKLILGEYCKAAKASSLSLNNQIKSAKAEVKKAQISYKYSPTLYNKNKLTSAQSTLNNLWAELTILTKKLERCRKVQKKSTVKN